jgi:hypothetical protein
MMLGRMRLLALARVSRVTTARNRHLINPFAQVRKGNCLTSSSAKAFHLSANVQGFSTESDSGAVATTPHVFFKKKMHLKTTDGLSQSKFCTNSADHPSSRGIARCDHQWEGRPGAEGSGHRRGCEC